MKILLIDNNDSFTRNLEHLILSTRADIDITIVNCDWLNDSSITYESFKDYSLIVISPGPGHPSEYSNYHKVFAANKPVLGICLGLQIINEYFGGKTSMLKGCCHGKTDSIVWENGVTKVARYHSLYISRVGKGLVVNGVNKDMVPMIINSCDKKVLGFQFHPESFLTENNEDFIRYAFRFFNI